MTRPLLALAIFLLGCAGQTAPPAAAPTIPTRADDVASVDGIMAAFYEVVNVGPDEPRQWARDRTLYVPWVRFVSIGRDGAVTLYEHPQFVADTEPLIRQGFREREIWRVTRRYGRMVHVDSTYETLLGPERRRSRGVNSVELYFDGTRWWIASVIWQSESPALPIPDSLLPAPAVPR